ncbi:hypothetical protein IWQ60_008326, partial [Tieghemiomyces parasiticus]
LSYNPLGDAGLTAVAQCVGAPGGHLEKLWVVDCVHPEEDAVSTADGGDAAAREVPAVPSERVPGSAASIPPVTEAPPKPDAGANWDAWATALQQSTTLRALYLDRCRLGDAGATRLRRGLANNQTLDLLSLRDNHLTDAGVGALTEPLLEDTADLARLATAAHPPAALRHLDLSENRITPAGLAELLQCPRLQELALYANRVAIAGPIPQLGSGDNAGSLVRLDISCNDITDEGFRYFSGALKAGLLPNLRLLEAAGNASQDQLDAWQPLVDALVEARPELEVHWKRYENTEMTPQLPPQLLR